MREMTCFPLDQRYPVTSPYGYRIDPITGAASSFHRGIDYGAPWGAPVLAPFDGYVTVGNEPGGAGNWSWVVDGPYMFKSFHHDYATVTSGWVAAGTVIAVIDSTGSSTGAHAHMELWDGGVVIDPTWYFEQAPLFQNKDWFDMASEDDLRRIVHEELDKSEQEMRSWMFSTWDQFLKRFVPLNAMWTDGTAQYEVTFDGEGRRVKRRIRTTEEFNALKVARAISPDWMMDVSGDTDVLDSFPTVDE